MVSTSIIHDNTPGDAMHPVDQALGMRHIAELVENQAVADKLTALGIDLARGYHFHKPRLPSI
jgi:EAL domain-containing protein (putative c-di-GMP-specific phosphodiesterase class I)